MAPSQSRSCWFFTRIERPLVESDHRAHFSLVQADAHGRPSAGNEGGVEQLPHRPFKSDPVQDVALGDDVRLGA